MPRPLQLLLDNHPHPLIKPCRRNPLGLMPQVTMLGTAKSLAALGCLYSSSTQAGIPYPGQGDWRLAVTYLLSAGRYVSGRSLFWLGCAGCLVLISRRLVWPVVLLAGPPVLVIGSIYSGNTPIQLPGMPYADSLYNTRYGISLHPLLAFSVAAMMISVPLRWRRPAVWLVLLAVIAPWFFKHSPRDWVVWKEADMNSEARRAWTAEAARYFKSHLRPGDTIFTGSGDITGVFREAGIPLIQNTVGRQWPVLGCGETSP